MSELFEEKVWSLALQRRTFALVCQEQPMSTSHARSFFISFSGLVNALKRGDVTTDEVRDARSLFLFNSSRKNVFESPTEDVGGLSRSLFGVVVEDEKAFGGVDDPAALHELLKEAFTVAEREGRIVWRKPQTYHDWEVVAEILGSNGEAIPEAFLEEAWAEGQMGDGLFTPDQYPQCKRLMEAHLPHVNVVY